jgi:hypothetical protein
MLNTKRTTSLLCVFCGIGAHTLYAQAAATASKPGPDVLVFTDGEKITGQLERANDTSVVFKSDILGEITVDWTKIQEFRSPQKFAVIRKGTKSAQRQRH